MAVWGGGWSVWGQISSSTRQEATPELLLLNILKVTLTEPSMSESTVYTAYPSLLSFTGQKIKKHPMYFCGFRCHLPDPSLACGSSTITTDENQFTS